MFCKNAFVWAHVHVYEHMISKCKRQEAVATYDKLGGVVLLVGGEMKKTNKKHAWVRLLVCLCVCSCM
jgi:hypothetical protein